MFAMLRMLAATMLVAGTMACTEEIHLDTNQDGVVDRDEMCRAYCACESDRAACENDCHVTPPPTTCAEEAAQCVLEEKYEGNGCSAGLQGGCYSSFCDG